MESHLHNLKSLDTNFGEWCALERDVEQARRVYRLLPRDSRRQVAVDTLDILREEVERDQRDEARAVEDMIAIGMTSRFGLKLQL